MLEFQSDGTDLSDWSDRENGGFYSKIYTQKAGFALLFMRVSAVYRDVFFFGIASPPCFPAAGIGGGVLSHRKDRAMDFSGWILFFSLASFLVGYLVAAFHSDDKKFFEFGYRKGYRDAKLGVPPNYPDKDPR